MENEKLTKNLKLKIKNAQLTKTTGLDKLKEKLAKAGTDVKNSTRKSSTKTLSKTTPVSGATNKEETAPTRRIRAKSHSAFKTPSDVYNNTEDVAGANTQIVEEQHSTNCTQIQSEHQQQDVSENTESKDSSDTSINYNQQSRPSDMSPVSTIIQHPTPSSPKQTKHNHDIQQFDTEQETLTPPRTISSNDNLGTSNSVTPPANNTLKRVASINAKFGPTGKHVSHLLNKGNTTSTSKHESGSSQKQDLPSPPPSTEGSVRNSSNKREAKKPTDTKDTRKRHAYENKTHSNKDRKDRYDSSEIDDDKWRKKRVTKHKKNTEEPIQPSIPSHIKIRLPITVKDLAAEMKLKSSELIQKLFIHGMTYVVNDVLDNETTVQFIGLEFGCNIEIDNSKQEQIQVTSQTVKEEIETTDPSKLLPRPPVVAFMGHVDHGKTSLIDALRKSNIASGEAGAITQHIGAFSCSTSIGTITILDTPGHEAFSAMRARGADICDIVVLVVAGDEGIKAQTIEAIQHAKNAGIVVLVAINKCDKPNFNPDQVYRQLADADLLPEAWGGSVITVNTSAKTGEGLPELLEMLSLQAEVLELKADPSARARGIVIESKLHKGLGYVATVLVQNGTLELGNALVFNHCHGKVKTMHNEMREFVKCAPPATPVQITGLSNLPSAGDPFVVVANEKLAREIVEARIEGLQIQAQQQKKTLSFDAVLQNKKVLKLILKADVQGSVEALAASIYKIHSDKVNVEIVSTGVGEISESDIRMAAASKATIIGFHTNIESHAESLIKSMVVSVKLFDVIYHAIDEIKELMVKLLDPIAEEKELGSAEIKAVFKSSQLGSIYGCLVTHGSVIRNSKARILRAGEVIWSGSLSSLKRIKEDVKEVRKGLECGIYLENCNFASPGDILQCYEIIYHPQTL